MLNSLRSQQVQTQSALPDVVLVPVAPQALTARHISYNLIQEATQDCTMGSL
jgi:hypothetical protein